MKGKYQRINDATLAEHNHLIRHTVIKKIMMMIAAWASNKYGHKIGSYIVAKLLQFSHYFGSDFFLLRPIQLNLQLIM